MSEYQYNKGLLSAEQDGMKLKLRNCTKDDAEEVRLAYFNYLQHNVEELERTLPRSRAKSSAQAQKEEEKKKKKPELKHEEETDESKYAPQLSASEKTEKSREKSVSTSLDEKFLMPNPLFDESDKVKAMEETDDVPDDSSSPSKETAAGGKKRKATEGSGSKSKRKVSTAVDKSLVAEGEVEVKEEVKSKKKQSGKQKEEVKPEKGTYRYLPTGPR